MIEREPDRTRRIREERNGGNDGHNEIERRLGIGTHCAQVRLVKRDVFGIRSKPDLSFCVWCVMSASELEFGDQT